MKFYLLSDNHDTLVGMRLAGIEGDIAKTADEVESALKKAIADESIGIILITNKLVPLCPELIYNLKLTISRPLIVQIPDRHLSENKQSTIAKYVKEAIGVDLE